MPSSPSSRPPRFPRWRPALALALLAAVLSLPAALAMAWWWTGTDGSLAWTLQSLQPGGLLARVAQRAGVNPGTVTASNATGSLRHGGHVDRLEWQQPPAPDTPGTPGLNLQAEDLWLEWQALALLRGELKIDRLEARSIVLTPPPAQEAAAPETVVLPLPVDVRFKVQQLQWRGVAPLQLDTMAGQYSYMAGQPDDPASAQHRLVLDSISLAQGQYRLQAHMQARSPMALQARIDGQVQSAVPGSGSALALQAHADIQGTLAGAAAALDLQAQVRRADSQANARPSSPARPAKPGTPSPAPGPGPTLDATVRLLPWATQPIQRAQVVLARLNLADFWPQAPVTSLSGTVSAEPAGDDWRANVALTNTVPGPWDRRRLPVQSLEAQVLQQDRLWTVQTLHARAGGGELTGQGRWQQPGPAGTPAAEPWQGQLTVSHVNPAALYSPLTQARIDGRLSARAQGAGTAFEVSLKPAAGQGAVPEALKGLALGEAQAAGLWQGDSLRLSLLSLQAAQAQLRAQGELRLARRSFEGTADLSFPGGNARFKGQLPLEPARDSQGELQAALLQADTTWAWLNRLPGVPAQLAAWGLGPAWRDATLRGQAELAVSWQGRPGSLSTQARLDVPELRLQLPANATTNGSASAANPAPEPFILRGLHATAQGPQSALRLQLEGLAMQAPYQVRLNSQAVADLGSLQQGTLDVSRLVLQLQDSARNLAGTLQALPSAISSATSSTSAPAGSPAAAEPATPLKLRWKDGGFELQPGQLRLSPQDMPGRAAPRNETVTLAWELLRWDSEGLRTRGRLSQLSLAWVDWLAAPLTEGKASAQPLADLGLGGQLWLDGDWNLFWPRDSQKPVRLDAGLQRQRGDLRVTVDDGSGAKPVAAGLREASLRFSAERGADPAAAMALRARLRWDSERAGQVDAEASTVLQAGAQGWAWAANAPLKGSLSAQLPQIGVWSLLAPPGWRMRGTLAAQATLGGTRSTPLWQGQLQADQLALRSVVDGVEFVNGQLRATLAGERVVIERFALEGAGGAKAGGQLEASGSAQWRLQAPAIAPATAPATSATAGTPSAPPATSASQRPRRVPQIDLQLTLDRLRVSSRVDRRLVLSGQVQASLAGAQLRLRGKLKADQAAITLPDEFTPRLGDDVVVRGRQTGPASAAPATQVVPDVLLDLDLGDNFAVEGSGIKARLQGTLQVRSTPEQPVPRLQGEVRTVSGSYRAYGVNLTVETGLLRFAGPYDNPSLDILAIRPNITQRVGVQVTGTALAPVLRLYAEPELPDTEKLAWVVLGRSAVGQGGELAILQQAALSLLGRKGSGNGLASALGLDDLSYRSGGVNADGSVTTAAVSLGKRLSSRLYVVYGRGLTSSVGTVSILYELSRRLTVRAQAGEDNALELVFTQRYD